MTAPARARPRPATRCKKCRNWMVVRPRGACTDQLPEGRRFHETRGLCGACAAIAERAGQLDDYERINRSRDEVLHEWNHLRADGATRTTAAERMGMTRIALERAIYRGRADGDPRAVLGNP